MTTITTQTNKTALNEANPNRLPSAFQNVGIGDVLASMGAPTTETLAVNAAFKCTLSKIPVPGSIIAARKTGGYLTQAEVHNACTLAQGQFSVDYTTGEVTFETTDFNDTNEAVFTYMGLTTGETSGSALAEALAAHFEE